MTRYLYGVVNKHVAERSPKAIVAVLAFAAMTASVMQTVLIPLQAELPHLLNAGRDDTAWAITITSMTAAIVTPIAGRLGDMFGKRRVAIVLLLVVLSGCIVAALSQDVLQLIVGRGLQGAGIGLIPLGISILRDQMPLARIATGVALISATMGFGGALGLPFAAFIAQYLDWHWVFWLVGILVVISLVLYVVIVPRGHQDPAPGRIDWLGVLGLTVGLAGLLLAVSKGNTWGWTSPATLISLGSGIVAFILWGFYQWRAKNPLVDLRLSATKPVFLTNASSISMGFALYASAVTFPQAFTVSAQAGGLGLSLFVTALLLMPTGLAMLGLSPVSGWLQRRFGARRTMLLGALIITGGYAACAIFQPHDAISLALANLVIGIGSTFSYSSMPTLTMQAVPLRQTGAANGINTLMRGLGTSFAAATVGAVFANTSIIVAGVPSPTMEGFRIAYLFGLGAAVISATFAAFIPRWAGTPLDDERGQ